MNYLISCSLWMLIVRFRNEELFPTTAAVASPPQGCRELAGLHVPVCRKPNPEVVGETCNEGHGHIMGISWAISLAQID